MSRVLYHLSYTAGGSAGGRMLDSDDIGTDAGGRSGCGGWVRTSDLRGMSPTSFHCSTPHREHSAGRAPHAAVAPAARPSATGTPGDPRVPNRQGVGDGDVAAGVGLTGIRAGTAGAGDGVGVGDGV